MRKSLFVLLATTLSCQSSSSNWETCPLECAPNAQCDVVTGECRVCVPEGEPNCGKLGDVGWVPPEYCECRGPNGETSYTTHAGEQLPIRCDDMMLQACPSSSGIGCSLALVREGPADACHPYIVEMHLDIGGHLHDLCCNSYYANPTDPAFQTACNGCTGEAEAPEACDGESLVGSVAGRPYNRGFPCATEWSYAVAAFFGTTMWRAPFDTSIRWTRPQAVQRGMAGVSGGYLVPSGNTNGEPLYGRALAPTPSDRTDRRAPFGTRLGSADLSLPYDPAGKTLGLSEAQIASFCQSERAAFRDSAWWCQ